MEPKIERKYVEAAKQDPEQFGPVYDHYHPHIRRFFAVKLNKASVIDDLTSVTFEKALKNIQKFKWQGYSFSAWLYRIASNTLTDFFRKQARDNTTGITDTMQLVSTRRSPEEEAELYFETRVLQAVLKKLPQKEQRIIYMKFYDGYTNKLIAEKLNISESNVGTILHRTMLKLRKELLI